MIGKYFFLCTCLGVSLSLIYEMGHWVEIRDASKIFSILQQTQDVAKKIQLPLNYTIVKGEENIGHGHYVWYNFTLDVNSRPCHLTIFNVVEQNQVFTLVQEDTCGVKVDPNA